jgi:ketol-acid reductoisomerase
MANVYYEKDADRSKIAGRKVAVLGYGSQGHAHALNLKESGIDVRVGLREGSSSRAKAEAAGLKVLTNAEAAAEADVIMMLLPDTEIAEVYARDVAPNLNEGDALFFAHGFNVRFGYVQAPAGVDVALAAPKGPGHLVAPHLHRGWRRAVPDRRGAGRHRRRPRPGSGLRRCHRRYSGRGDRDHVHRGDRDRPVR